MSETVGKISQRLRRRYNHSIELYRAFACGFVAGQAEKVFLGVCPAAMFRPSRDNFEWHLQEVKAIAIEYGLMVTVLNSESPDTPQEIWIHRHDFALGSWAEHAPNSIPWHRLRAAACGIPENEVDSHYHCRDGYGETCD